jgi:hypothetical protein
MFQKAMHFQTVIVFYYNKQTTMKVIRQMPPLLTWQISQIIVDYLSPIVIACVLNRSHEH